MIDIPGIYVGRFKDNPNNRSKVMTRESVPTYTDDNWANVESTGTIWRYSSEAGEWIDTGLEEILVEEVSGTKKIVAEGTVPWKLQGLNVYGKSTQETTTGAQLIDAQAWQTVDSEYYKVSKDGGIIQLKRDDRHGKDIPAFLALEAGEYTASVNSGFILQIIKEGANLAVVISIKYDKATFTLDSAATLVMKVYEYPSTNIYPSSVAYPMINSGSTALPWEPYTGGQPSPSPDYPQEIVTAGADGTIDVSIANSDGTEPQTLTFNTPNGLPGIPVDSGGNFTDADGQQWICDEVDFERGVYIQRIGTTTIDGQEDWIAAATNAENFYRYVFYHSGLDDAFETSRKSNAYTIGLCKSLAFASADVTYMRQCDSISVGDSNNPDTLYIYAKKFEAGGGVDAFKAWLSSNPQTLHMILKEPTEAPLSAEELAAYAALMSYDDRTVISTDEDISGISAKVVTDVISKNAWFDPYAELARYYKALAGFESFDNLPIPHSRESSLVRKLLDSSYELGFSVNENSSRNERYLWDLINGTSTMLTNIPKSDTEKFLHVMIGGTVEEYPVVDTELDYWMDKCVNYMRSNGSIGG